MKKIYQKLEVTICVFSRNEIFCSTENSNSEERWTPFY